MCQISSPYRTHFSDIYEWRTTIYEEKKYLFQQKQSIGDFFWILCVMFTIPILRLLSEKSLNLGLPLQLKLLGKGPFHTAPNRHPIQVAKHIRLMCIDRALGALPAVAALTDVGSIIERSFWGALCWLASSTTFHRISERSLGYQVSQKTRVGFSAYQFLLFTKVECFLFSPNCNKNA